MRKLVPRMFLSPLLPLSWEDERLGMSLCQELLKTGERSHGGGDGCVHCMSQCHLLAFLSTSRCRSKFRRNGLHLSDFNKLLSILVDPIICNCLSFFFFFVFTTRFHCYFQSRARPLREIFDPAPASYVPDDQTNTIYFKFTFVANG